MWEGLTYMYPIKYHQRRCTDWFCGVLYLLLTFTLLGGAFYSFILQREQNLFFPQDPDGRRCGEGEAINYPFIYFPAPFVESLHNSVCVRFCPTDQDSLVHCLPNSLVRTCTYNITDHFNRSNQFIIYKTSTNQLFRLCQPDPQVLLDSLNSEINTSSLFANIQTIYDVRYVMVLFCPLICMGLILLYLLLVSCVTDVKYLVYAVLWLFWGILFGFGCYLIISQVRADFSFVSLFGMLMILSSFSLLIYARYDRIRIQKTIQLLNLGSLYVLENPLVILLPLGSFICWAVIFCFELVIFLTIYAIDDGQHQQSNSFAFLTGITNSTVVNVLLIMVVCHYCWTSCLIEHMNKYLSKALATNWVLPIQNPFTTAIYCMLKFHMGTILHGSLTLTLFSWVSDVLYFLMPGPRGNFLCCELECLIRFYQSECFLRFLGKFTETAYIRVNLEGEGLCEAGSNLTPLLVYNLCYINRAYRLARVFILTSKFIISVFTTAICWAMVELDTTLKTHIISTIIFLLISWLLVGLATDPYHRSFQTILITILLNNAWHNDENPTTSSTHTAKVMGWKKIQRWFMDIKKEQQALSLYQ